MVRSAGAPRPRRRDFADSRRRLLDAARVILAERGPEALTVSEVAHRAGLNRTTAYQHFRTRDELSAAVMAETADEILSMFHGPQVIWGHIGHMVPFFADHPEFARLTLRQILSEIPLPESGWNTYLGWIRKIVERRDAQPGIDAEMLSYVLLCVGVLWPLLARAQYEDAAAARDATHRLARELERLFLHGVLQPEAWPDRVGPTARRRIGGPRRSPVETSGRGPRRQSDEGEARDELLD